MALTTRMWLSAGVFCFGLSIIMGYHQDQVVANNVLAEKVAFPAPVMIQEFDQARDANLLNEVQLVGEAALEETVTLNLGTEVAPNWVQMLPIYPVGAVSRPFADKFFAAGERRPMPRSRSSELAIEAAGIKPLEREPMGLIILESGVSISEAVLHQSLGEGLNGPLVMATGSLVSGDALLRLATDAFNGHVMLGVPVVAPYLQGARIAVEPVKYDALRSILDWTAVVLILIGVGNAFSITRWVKWKKPETAESFEHVEAVGAFPGVFQAIRTQEDLVREEQEESERAAAASRRTFSRINYS